MKTNKNNKEKEMKQRTKSADETRKQQNNTQQALDMRFITIII